MPLSSERVVAPPPSVANTAVPTPREGARSAEASPRFAELLHGLARRVDAGEGLVRRAVGGELGGLDAPALIAVQAGIYHYTEAIELAGKLIDRTTGAVRTVLQPGS